MHVHDDIGTDVTFLQIKTLSSFIDLNLNIHSTIMKTRVNIFDLVEDYL